MFRIAGILRNLFDFTALDGALLAQDDRDPDLLTLPVDRLRSGLRRIGFELIDMRQEPRTGRGAAVGTRKIEKVTALLFHQTASLVDLSQATGIPCHALILEDTVVLVHAIRAYVNHAGAGNSYTIGVEIRCRAAGIEGNLQTLWRSRREKNGYTDKRGDWHPPKTAESLVLEAADGQLEAGRLTGIYYVEEVERQGGEIVAAENHRNTAGSRVSDPGSRIAIGVVLWLATKFGILYGGPVVGTGKKTPQAWGGKRGVRYNWRFKGF